MAKLESTTSMPMGSDLPEFDLLSVSGQRVSKDSLREKNTAGVIVAFICNHCPYVVHIRQALIKVAHELSQKKIRFIAINSNDADSYPDDSYSRMVEDSSKYNYSFDYLFDETQEVAKKFEAVCTPEFFVFDEDLKLRYHGQFDGSRPGNSIVPTGNALSSVVDAVLSGQKNIADQRPSIGCSIKWK